MGKGAALALVRVRLGFFFFLRGGASLQGFLKPQPATRPAPHGYIIFGPVFVKN